MRPLNTGLSLTSLATMLTLLLAAALPGGCGGSTSSVDTLDMLLDGTLAVYSYDVQAVTAGDAGEELEDMLQDHWDSSLADIGILMDEAEVLTVGGDEDHIYSIVQGEFDFEHIRDELIDGGYDDDDYRGYEIWTGGGRRDVSTVALIDEDGLVLAGGGDTVERLVRSLARDQSARDGDLQEMLRAMDRAGDGWALVGLNGCADALRGCSATAVSIESRARYELRATAVFLFRDESAADAGLDDIEDLAMDIFAGFDYQDPRLRREIVTVAGTIDQDDFADQARIKRGSMSW